MVALTITESEPGKLRISCEDYTNCEAMSPTLSAVAVALANNARDAALGIAEVIHNAGGGQMIIQKGNQSMAHQMAEATDVAGDDEPEDTEDSEDPEEPPQDIVPRFPHGPN